MDKLTRVTTRGVSRFRADALANQNTNADVFRSTCIPGLPLGFQRQLVNVQLSPDGLTLLWQVEDQEMFTSIGSTDDPGRGTVEKFEASFAMRTMGPDAAAIPGAYLMGRFHGAAMGSKASSRSAMFAWLARLAIERMALPNGVVNPAMQPTVMAVSYHEDIHQPYVTLDIDVKFPPSIQGKQGLAIMRVDFLGVDIIKMFSNDGMNPQMPGDSNTRGTANVAAFAAAIKEACSAVPALPYQSGGSQGYASDNYTASTVDVQVTAYGDLPDSSTSYSPDVQRGTYKEISVQSTWRTSQGNMQVPIAGKPSQQGSSYTPGGAGSGVTTSSTDDPPPDTEVITLSRPCTELTITFEAERSNVPPIIPNANSTDANLVLLREEISPLAVALDTDGVSPVYRIGGRFTYAARSARKVGAAINFGVAPFTTFSYSDTMAQLGPDSMSNGIVDPPGDPAGGDA